MNYNDMHYNYVQLMRQAEQATNRKEALDCIHRATALRAAADVLKQQQPTHRYERWG